ncbi:hypothetical protein BDB01DRAFT_838412 [Pilobolus umbonatus]|nr:hypothetical protein BDB01DRAFT_838412 [Pilobolus umbonatus]
MKYQLLSILFLLFDTVLTVNVAPKTGTYCTYLNEQIYCAGNFDATFGAPSDMIALHVHNTTATTLSSMKFAWERITFNDDLEVAARRTPQFIASPDRHKMYLQGGYNDQNTVFKSPFLVFDDTTKVWTSLPDFKRDSVTNGQIRRASVSYVPSINKLVFYGGLTGVTFNQTVAVDGNTYDTIQSTSGSFLPFGFYHLTTFDMETQKWEEISDATGYNNTYFRYALHTISSPNTNSVYFLGGYGRPRENGTLSYFLGLGEMAQFSFTDNLWTEHTLISPVPSNRDYFTTTLLNDNKTVLLYGGRTLAGDVFPDNEICYLLDLDTYSWRSCPIELPANINASRDLHSAVLVKNFLFILFGRTNNVYLDDFIVLDVSDLTHIKYVPQYAYPLSSTDTANPPKDGGLGTGAIVGIEPVFDFERIIIFSQQVAVIIGVVFYMRKKKSAKETDSTQDFPADWDAINQEIVNENTTEAQNSTVVNENIQFSPTVGGVVKPMEINTPVLSKPNS